MIRENSTELRETSLYATDRISSMKNIATVSLVHWRHLAIAGVNISSSNGVTPM
jgi:hypothetical protein